MFKKLLLILVVLSLAPFFAKTARADKAYVWTGADFTGQSYFTYVGGVVGISGQKIDSEDGWMLRATAAYGAYEYETEGVAGGNVDVDMSGGDVMAGYSHKFKDGSVGLYGGGNIENHDASPEDQSNKTAGFAAGAKVLGDVYINPYPKVTVNAMGSYSTANKSYWSRIMAGYDVGRVTVGPDVSFLGNEEFKQTRVGAALTDIDLGPVHMQVYTGYGDSKGQGKDGIYGGVGFSKNF